MSSYLEKLEFQSLRSYGQETVIRFYKPLNLIVGTNGSGKTTLIEVLKYALTGSCPPPDKNGMVNFVRDPKLVPGTNQVHAYIRLKFRDRRNNAITVARSMQVSVAKSGNPSFKTLMSSITTKGEDGKKHQIQGKCSEIDSLVPVYLSVSAAVVEAVIFAHQDESNWPFESSAHLKERFDEIFAATHYREALEELKKQMKEQTATMDRIKGELEARAAFRTQYLELAGRVEEAKKDVTEKAGEIEALNAQQAELEARIAEARAAVKATEDITREAEALQATVTARAAVATELYDKLEAEFDETDEQLEIEAKRFRAKIAASEDYLRAAADRLTDANRAVDNLQAECRSLQAAHGKAQAEAEAHVARLAERSVRIDAAARRHGLPAPAAGADASATAAQFLRAIDAAVHRLQDEQRARKAEAVAADDAAGRDILALSSSLTEHEVTHKAAVALAGQKEAELASLRRELAQLGAAGHRPLYEVEAALREAEAEEARLRPLMSASGIEAEIAVCARQIADTDAQAQEVSEALNRLSAETAARAKARVLEGQLAVATSQQTALLAEHDAALRAAFNHGALPSADAMEARVDALIEAAAVAERTTLATTASLTAARDAAVTAAASASAKAAELNREATELDERIRSRFLGLDFMTTLGRAQDKLKAARETLSSMSIIRKASVDMYQAFKELALAEHKCPLCERDFDRKLPAAFQTFVASLDATMADVDRRLSSPAETEAEIRKFEALELQIQNELPVVRRRDELLASLVPEANAAAAAAEAKRAAAANALAAYEAERGLPARAALAALRLLRDPARAITAAARTVLSTTEDLRRESASLRSTMSSVGSGPETADTLSARLRSLRADAAEARANSASLTARLAAKRDELRVVEGRLRALRDELTRLTAAETSRAALQTRAASTEAAIADARRNAAAADAAAAPMQSRISARERERGLAREAAATREASLAAQISAVDVDRVWVADATRAIADYETRSGTAAGGLGEAAMRQIANKERELGLCIEERTRAQADLDTHRNQHAEVKGSERSIADNLSYRRANAEVAVLRERLAVMTAQIESQERMAQPRAALTRLSKQREELLEARSRASGALDLIATQLAANEAKLETDEYRNATSAYAAKRIELVTAEVLVRDLKKYTVALDAALLRYHELKMAEVNATMQELWQKTYRGADIDTIAIRADNDSRKKASYNYRVVICKDGNEMQARGRCSAGQKVLASLIVRLALAQAFCSRCGVLALDEPTTNLDKKNSDSFARSLATLIEERMALQLIVITHDKSFVRQLGSLVSADTFLQVSKDANGCSKIDVRPMSALTE